MNPYDEQQPAQEPARGSGQETPDDAPPAVPWWSRPDPAPHETPPETPSAPPFVSPDHAAFGPQPLGSASEPLPDQPYLPAPDADAARKKMDRKRFRTSAALTAAAVVVSAAVTGTVVHVVDGNGTPTAVAEQSTTTNLPPAANGNLSASVKSALDKIEPSVVVINDTMSTGPNGRGGFGGFGGFQATGAGTGIIISADGLVVTNAHVVNNASNIKVTLPNTGGPNNGGTHDASVVGMDTSQDLAVIKVSGVSGLTAATFADSDTVEVGDSVIAVGNALGYGGAPTVTEGIISAKGRSLQDSAANMTGLLQTDAAINPGNSGGPLVDAKGDVVGINVAVATGSPGEPAQNIGFAIPSNTVEKALPDLKAGKNSGGATQSAAFLGVQVTDAFNGAGVVAVQPNSPAANAGLRSGDVITKVNDTTVANGSDLQTAIRAQKPGDTVTLTVIRNGSTTTVTVKLGTTRISS